MAEIIGVAASATQLGIACFALIDIMRKIKGGAATLKKYHEQLQELQSLSTSISQNPLLQTPEIGTQTRALLSIISNNCLNSLLRKGRFLRTWGFLCRAQDLLDIFVRLERQKSNLSLAIEQIQSKALYQIQSDIQTMSEKKENPSSLAADLVTKESLTPEMIAQLVSAALAHSGSSGSTSSSNIDPDLTDPQTFNLYIANLRAGLVPALPMNSFANNSSHPNDRPSSRPSSAHHSSASSNQPTDPTSEDNAGPVWNNCVADPHFNQENRRIYRMNGKLAKELSSKKPNRCIHRNPVKLGRGDQNNRHYIKFVGDSTGAVEPDMSGDRWDNARILDYPSLDPKAGLLGTQFNGIEVDYEESPSANEKGK